MSQNVEEHYLAEQIRQALALDDRVNELGLSVVVADDKAVITGAVSTAQRRDAVPAVVAEIVPGYAVDNQTSVVSDDETEQIEEMT